jgi:serine protease Do
MRMKLAAAVLLTFGLGHLVAAENEKPEELLQRVNKSIVVINQAARAGTEESIGAGFVVSNEGLIATSFHVIGEGRPITVTFLDGKTYAPTEIHAWDRKTDLALLKIPGTNFIALKLGDSDNLKQGRRIYALGNPQGLKFSAVEGIVSAIREFDSGPMIQVAVPVEPGNSGGPLIDEKGRVQGVISMKSLMTENLGFAVPINALKLLIEKPNPVPMEKWLTLGTLPKSQWETVMGASWRRKAGMIRVEGQGSGFGGRSLCISTDAIPEKPYEISVTVKLDDESGAAGLALGIDAEHRHYGFYPTAGKLRLTRFEGPTVYSWNILQDKSFPAYRSGDWNDLRVRVEEKKILCFVNGELVFEQTLSSPLLGRAGLAKFRDTSASFKHFSIRREANESSTKPTTILGSFQPGDALTDSLLADPSAARAALHEKAYDLERQADRYRKAADSVHFASIEKAVGRLFAQPEEKINLFEAAILIARLDNPDLETAGYFSEVAQLAEAAKKNVEPSASPTDQVKQFNKVFFEENGFHGSRSEYYSYENSYVSSVLDDREGIPLTLAIVYLEVASRAGLTNLYGLPFPGHFMVGFKDEKGLYVDVFDGGKIYGEDQIYKVVNERSEIPLAEKHFAPATKKEMIVRMLRNLTALASDRRDAPRVTRYIDIVLAVSPDESMERFRRAFIAIQSGKKDLAKRDLEYLLEQKPPELNLERVQELLEQL